MAEVKAYTEAELSRLSAELEDRTPQDVLRWAAREFKPGLTLACSFGGPSGMVLLDMTMQIDQSVDVFYLDTDFLFPETYHLRNVCEQKYGFKASGYKSLLTPQAQAAQYGDALWARDPDQCCELRKVEPNYRALEGKRAWIAGMRRDQAKTRANIGIVEWDSKFELVKVNPLANWDEAKVWGYIVANGVPYNELHDKSYPSIGCTYCTKPVAKGEDPRSGRWQGFDKEECGIQEGTVTVIHTTRGGEV